MTESKEGSVVRLEGLQERHSLRLCRLMVAVETSNHVRETKTGLRADHFLITARKGKDRDETLMKHFLKRAFCGSWRGAKRTDS